MCAVQAPIVRTGTHEAHSDREEDPEIFRTRRMAIGTATQTRAISLHAHRDRNAAQDSEQTLDYRLRLSFPIFQAE